jgi:hypothetical protein
MPVTGTAATARHGIVRMVRCVRGRMTLAVDMAPRFDYGREPPALRLTEDGAVFRGRAGTSMTVGLIMEPDEKRLADARVDDQGDVRAEVTLAAGQMGASYWRPARQGHRAESP